MRALKRLLAWLTLPCLLAIVGCGKSELKTPEVYPTRGTLSYQGERVRFKVVRLVPVDSQGAVAEGTTDEKGGFELRTFSNTQPDGAVPGKYRVEVEDSNPRDFAPPAGKTQSTLPTEARKPDLDVEVRAEDNDLTIDIP